MGLRYLKNNVSWSKVTREERFFCAHLYFLIKEEGLSKFVGYLSEVHNMSLPVDANWEAAYEACFYRDFWYHWDKKGELFSKKRTFDLCLLSDDMIIVIEAKSNQEFEMPWLN